MNYKQSFSANKRAFTLVELLIVIFIIGILFTIAAASYFRAQIIARDGRRKADLAHIATALEQFYQDHGAYPTEGWVRDTDNVPLFTSTPPDPQNPYRDSDVVTCGTDNKHITAPPEYATLIFPFNPFSCDGKTYLNSMPGDPLNGSSYIYEVYDDFGDPPVPPDWCLGVGRVDRCQKYTLWAKLENPPSPAVPPFADTQCNFTYDAVGSDAMDNRGYNYCIHQP